MAYRPTKKIIDEAQIIHLYVNEKLSETEISRRFGVSQQLIGRRLSANNVMRRTSSEACALLSDDRDLSSMSELVDGLLLGDGSIESKNGKTGRLSIGQAGPRRPWVDQLHSEFCKFGVTSSLYDRSGGPTIIKGKNCVNADARILRTHTYTWFGEQWQRWYPNGTKIVPLDVKLTPLSIALWYFGDGIGSTNKYVSFCTDSFTRSCNESICNVLQNTYGWHPTISYRNRILLLRCEDRKSLLDMIEPLTPECFRYKLNFHVENKAVFPQAQKEELLQLRQQGMSYDDLASKFEISKSHVGTLCRAADFGDIDMYQKNPILYTCHPRHRR